METFKNIIDIANYINAADSQSEKAKRILQIKKVAKKHDPACMEFLSEYAYTTLVVNREKLDIVQSIILLDDIQFDAANSNRFKPIYYILNALSIVYQKFRNEESLNKDMQEKQDEIVAYLIFWGKIFIGRKNEIEFLDVDPNLKKEMLLRLPSYQEMCEWFEERSEYKNIIAYVKDLDNIQYDVICSSFSNFKIYYNLKQNKLFKLFGDTDFYRTYLSSPVVEDLDSFLLEKANQGNYDCMVIVHNIYCTPPINQLIKNNFLDLNIVTVDFYSKLFHDRFKFSKGLADDYLDIWNYNCAFNAYEEIVFLQHCISNNLLPSSINSKNKILGRIYKLCKSAVEAAQKSIKHPETTPHEQDNLNGIISFCNNSFPEYRFANLL